MARRTRILSLRDASCCNVEVVNGAHAPGRKAASHFGPEERRYLVADQAIENSAGLLRVDAIHIDHVRMAQRRQCRLFGDLVQLDPMGMGEFQELRQVPGDCLALAIGIGREVDVGRAFDRAAQLFDDLAFSLNSKVFGRKIVLHVDAERALREVAHVAHRCFHRESRRQKLLDRPRLRG
jgi:hypothetical protein